MNAAPLSIIILAALFPTFLNAEERPPIYPFDVSVGGQEAVYSADFPIFAKIPKPVSPDAKVELKTEAEQIIVNLFPCAEDGTVPNGAPTKIIMVGSGTGFQLDQTMDKSKLTPGLYGMNIVLKSKGTGRVMFRIVDASAPDPAEDPNAVFVREFFFGKGATPGAATPPAPGGAPDQSTPESTLAAVFAAAKSGDLASLKALVPASGDLDGDVERIRDVSEAGEADQKEFKEWFATGKIVGAARIEGDSAEVDFTFGPTGKRDETMGLVRKGGKWYLDSF